MNLFILDTNPKKCAVLHNDTHTSKMLLEACQILCTAHHVHNPEKYNVPYKIAHLNHPCTIWVRETRGNYVWALQLAAALCEQYHFRTGKRHKCFDVVLWLDENKDLIKWASNEQTPFVLAMPDEYRTACPVQSYRNYHRSTKRGFWRKNKKTGFSVWYSYKWTKVNVPSFMSDLDFQIGQTYKQAI